MTDQASTILTALSDELTASGLVGEDEFWFNFNVGGLFFDSMPVSAASLLSNPRMRDAWSVSADGAAAIYSNGLLRPILMGKLESMAAVAEEMIRRRTIHHLAGAADLRRHAARIDSATFKEAWVDEQVFRRNYSLAYSRSLERGVSTRTLGTDFTIPNEDWRGVMKVVGWSRAQAAAKVLRATELHKFLATTPGLSLGTKRRLKLLADIAFYETQRRLLTTCLTVATSQIGLAALVNSSSSQGADSEASMVAAQVESFECAIPFRRLAKLPFPDIIQLRQTAPFVELRRMLHGLRRGEFLDRTEIRVTLVECADLLHTFTRDINRAARSDILRAAERESRAKSLKVFVNAGRVIAIGVGLATRTGVGLLMAAIGAGTLAVEHLQRRGQPKQYSLPEPSERDLIVDVNSGASRVPVRDGKAH
jgi:KaiC/GvpD/RAD55 family RecA-like ATPase